MKIFDIFIFCAVYLCLVIGYVKSADEGIRDIQTKQLYSLSTVQNYEDIQDHDLHQFIEKRRQKKWVIENDTDRCVELLLKASYVDRNYGKEATEIAPFQIITLGAHGTFTADSRLSDSDKKIIYEDINFNRKESFMDDGPLYLNLEKTDDTYKIHIQTSYTSIFPQIFEFSDFTPNHLYDSTIDAPVIVPSPQSGGNVIPIVTDSSLPIISADEGECPYVNPIVNIDVDPCVTPIVNPVVDPCVTPIVTPDDPDQVYIGQESSDSSQGTSTQIIISQSDESSSAASLTPNNLELGFIKQYNSHLNYLFKVQFAQEKIDKGAYFTKLNEVYQRNSLEKLLRFHSSAQTITSAKIPAITHTIWLTSNEEPRELPKRYLYWLKKSIEACPVVQGFKHWFWVHDKSKIPNTLEALSKLDVTVRETKEAGDFLLKDLYELEMNNRKYGRSSDIFRMAVLNQFGGIYKDTDYRIHQSMLPLLQSYDFFAAREPMSSFVCNALIGACPGHPVIRSVMDLIDRNYDEVRSPRYIKNIKDADGFKTILLTGPGVLVTGISKALDQSGYTDIVLPHPYLYPTPVDAYPQKWPSKPNQRVPAEAYGVHYWETSWAKTRSKEFGSFG